MNHHETPTTPIAHPKVNYEGHWRRVLEKREPEKIVQTRNRLGSAAISSIHDIPHSKDSIMFENFVQQQTRNLPRIRLAPTAENNQIYNDGKNVATDAQAARRREEVKELQRENIIKHDGISLAKLLKRVNKR